MSDQTRYQVFYTNQFFNDYESGEETADSWQEAIYKGAEAIFGRGADLRSGEVMLETTYAEGGYGLMIIKTHLTDSKDNVWFVKSIRLSN